MYNIYIYIFTVSRGISMCGLYKYQMIIYIYIYIYIYKAYIYYYFLINPCVNLSVVLSFNSVTATREFSVNFLLIFKQPVNFHVFSRELGSSLQIICADPYRRNWHTVNLQHCNAGRFMHRLPERYFSVHKKKEVW